MERLKELGPFCLEKKRLTRSLISVNNKYLIRASREDGDSLFSVVSSDRIGGDGHKLKHRKFHSTTRKKHFHCGSNQTLEQVVQRRCNLSIHSSGHPGLAEPA